MAYLLLFILFLTAPAMAQISPDNGVRPPQAMMVSGNSVIDDKNTDDTDVKSDKKTDDSPVLEMMMSDDADTLGDKDKVAPQMPIDPFIPSPKAVTKPDIKRELKKIPVVKSQRSISDDRIDDGYVQGLIKNNSTFTPAID